MKIALAYCEEDNTVAKKIETQLQATGHDFEHYIFSKTNPEFKLSEVLVDFQFPILLFISDKFLRSTSGMDRVLHFFQNKEEQILPIITSTINEGEISSPNIEKVGGIIKYINYWQEHYLDMRRQKRELQLADEESFERHLKIIRDISTEIGEFLRLLRSSTYYATSDLQANDYEVFFEFIDDEGAWEVFKEEIEGKKIEKEKIEKVEIEGKEIEKEKIEKVEIEGKEIEKEEIEEVEGGVDLEKELASIPGISLLSDDLGEVKEIGRKEIEGKKIEEEKIEKEEIEMEKIEEKKIEKEEIEMGGHVESAKSQASDTQNTLDALKNNIERLTTLLKSREKEKEAITVRPGEGKIVLITGATSGIGRATADIFAKKGFNLIITGRRKERLDEVSVELEKTHNIKTKILAFDVQNKDAAAEAIKSLKKEWLKIDVLINNAGKAKGFSPIHEGNLDHWEEMIDTNIKGLLYLSRLVSPLMVAQKSGHIVNIGSIAGKEAYPNGNVYCATKFAVDGLTKAMRIDLHSHNVRVSQIAPAHVEETEFALVRFDGDAEKAKIYEDFTPLNARDIAETIYFMVSRPAHVNILDVVIQGTQQPSATILDRSGRK